MHVICFVFCFLGNRCHHVEQTQLSAQAQHQLHPSKEQLSDSVWHPALCWGGALRDQRWKLIHWLIESLVLILKLSQVNVLFNHKWIHWFKHVHLLLITSQTLIRLFPPSNQTLFVTDWPFFRPIRLPWKEQGQPPHWHHPAGPLVQKQVHQTDLPGGRCHGERACRVRGPVSCV